MPLMILTSQPVKVAHAPEVKQSLDVREIKLSEFFKKYKCPEFNYTLIKTYVQEADKYGLDYRLLPAISIQESSCGRFYPRATNNPWGWASARTGFASFESGISFILGQLENGKYYRGKSLKGKLNAYNPNPEYYYKIIKLINQIN